MPPVDHECPLTEYVSKQGKLLEEQAARILALESELLALKRMAFGKKSEKMPSLQKALGIEPVPFEEQQKTRQERAALREKLPVKRVEHKVSEADKVCSSCGGTDTFTALGAGKVTSVIEHIPEQFIRVEHVQEVLRCSCGGGVVTASGAPKVIEGGKYGASVLAHLVVSKCINHTPLYRLEKTYKHQGVLMPRSTMNNLFHRAAQRLQPLSALLLQTIRERPIVQADETPLLMQDDGSGKSKKGFVWVFLAHDEQGKLDVAYVFASNRSGSTPSAVLGGTRGALLVDGYSGYNVVTDIDGRDRAGCHAHVRREFFDASKTEPIAHEALALILDLYRVEHEAKERRIVGTDEHLRLRIEKSAPIREKLFAWLHERVGRHLPKSGIGKAITYTINQWENLGLFLTDAKIPLDNNAGEREMRRIAMGRKNYLFVGNDSSGKNMAGLYSLLATCEARGINPAEYIEDMLVRIDDHPASKLDELLPANWSLAKKIPQDDTA